MTHRNKFEQAMGLWEKIDSVKRELDQMIDEMQQFSNEPWFNHFSVVLVATHPENEQAVDKNKTSQRLVRSIGWGSKFDRDFAAYVIQNPEEGTEIDK